MTESFAQWLKRMHYELEKPMNQATKQPRVLVRIRHKTAPMRQWWIKVRAEYRYQRACEKLSRELRKRPELRVKI